MDLSSLLCLAQESAGATEETPRIILLLAVFVLSGLLFLPSEQAATGRSIAAAAGFLSNVYFWTQAGYFTAPAEAQPLLHTWSLAVEEQFYIVFPPLLYLMATYARRHLALLLAGLCTLSFAACVVLTELHQPTAFYMLPTRAWELGIGAGLALWTRQRGGPQPGSLPLAALGVALVVVPMVLLDKQTAFPGWVAVVPVLGATLLIGWGNAGPVGRLLSSVPMVAVGKVSYSFYLWHWPVIVFWKVHAGEETSGLEMLALGLVSLGLAALSTHFIERPFRTPRARHAAAGRVVALGGLGLAALAGIGGLASYNLVPLRGFPDDVVQIASVIDYRERPDYAAQFRTGSCLIGQADGSFEAFDAAECANPETGAYNVLVIGDSHAAQFWGPLAEAFPGANIMQATSSGCRALLGAPGAPRCTDLRAWVFDEFLPQSKVDRVVLGGRWLDEEMPYVAETLARLKTLASSVVVIGPTVEYEGSFPSLLARSRLRDEPFDAAAYRVEGRDEINARMKTAAEAASVTYVDVLATECDDDGCLLFAPDGMPMQFDYGHLTFSGARAVVAAHRDAFLPARFAAVPAD